MSQSKNVHEGSCHCGAVRFRFEADLKEGGARCNCSICTKLNAFGRGMKPDAFQLLQGKEKLGSYVWGGKISTRYFCRDCGVYCFANGHLAEMGGDYVSVNLNAVDGVELDDLKVIYWDGRHDNWHAGPSDKPWPIGVASQS